MHRSIATLTLTLLASSVTVAWAGAAQAAPGCIKRDNDNSWGAGAIEVCASGGEGFYSGYTKDKKADGSCVRWRIDWDNKPSTYTQWACPEGNTTQFNEKAPAGVSGVKNAFFERVKV